MEHMNIFLVGVEGLVSFLSPCILPLLPVYLSVLANSSQTDERYQMQTLIKNTLGFVAGISTTFFILGMSVYTVGDILNSYQTLLTLIGGFIIIIMGLFYLGLIQSNLLNQDKRYHMKVGRMNIFSAFILGLTFSFGWTPCIGPTLASVLVMASTSDSKIGAMLLIFIYTIGFTMPFIIVAIFYEKLVNHLNQLKKHMGIIKKLGGIILIISGIAMIITASQVVLDKTKTVQENSVQVIEDETYVETQEVDDRIKALDFNLYDQYGMVHSLSQYKGKIIFLNFWATWCPPCKKEMPYIEEIYEEYGKNSEDVIILGVVNPQLGKEGSQEYIESFLEENGYTFPVVFDTNYDLLYSYGISAFPSTLIIDAEGYINLYVPGAMDKVTMKQIIEEAK